MTRRMRRATRRAILASVAMGIVVAGVLASSCAPKPRVTQAPFVATKPDGAPHPARVLILEAVPQATVAVGGPYTLALPADKGSEASRVLAGGQVLVASVARVSAAALIVGERHFPDNEVVLTTGPDGAVTVDGKRYRGGLILRRAGEDKLSVVNVLRIEDYLYSVLGGETYASWPAAALEAQAIVARSYAMWRMAQRREQPFDLYATVLDQRYEGMASEGPSFRSAVDRTAGAVLLYQMQLFRCYYHSTCGGHTEAVENVFPDPPLLPLSAVPCQYCKGSKHFRWQVTIPKGELADALRKNGASVQQVVSLSVGRRTEAGRALAVVVGVEGGRELVMPAGDFRLAVGARRLPSAWFEAKDLRTRIEFDGRGWGHGVGMCQWGAKGMADAGSSTAEILRHYYPGAEVQRLYDGRGSS